MSGAQKLYGNNKVFCKGKLISGPDCRSCVASFLMILVPSILWHVSTGPFYADRYTVLIPLVVALLQVSSLVLLVWTAFSDPGIMPRAKYYADVLDTKTKVNRTKPPPRYHELVLRGHPFRIKYCTTCNIYRPPRCTHCSVCENCIERFDHHCPWLGNCVGKRNYWLFFSFVSSTGSLNVSVLVTAVCQLAVITEDLKELQGLGGGDAFVESMGEEPLAVVLAVYAAGIVWFTVGLCLYHTYLICTNQTTYEQIKGVYSTGANPQNPFHRGILGNCQDILCSKIRPRYFDPAENRLLWNTTPADEEAREIRCASGRGEKRYLASGSIPLKGPRDASQAKANASNDPFLNLASSPGKKQAHEEEENEDEISGNNSEDPLDRSKI